MVDENYPLPLKGPMSAKYANYVFSKDEYTQVSSNSPLFAVDCEMCLTTAGKLELTKVCVVNSQLEVVYHTLVKPYNAITNYLTRYSGITSALLQDVETRLEDVQESLRKLLPSDAIWIGQSLNGDLNALQMMHPYVIDTSVIYNITGESRRKTKLKTLSHMFLGETIQDKGVEGHDPKEDAIAAMKLVLLKLEKGYDFGDAITDNVQLNQQEQKTVSTTLLSTFQKSEKKINVVSTSELLETYSKYWKSSEAEEGVQLHTANNAKEAVKKACQLAFESDLNLCHVQMDQQAEASDKVKKMSKWTKKVWSHTSINGMFITVCTGSPVDQRAFLGIALNKANIE